MTSQWRHSVTKMYFFLYQLITSNWYIICYWISVYVKIHYFMNRLVYLVFIFGLFIIPKWGVHLWHFCHFFLAALLCIAKERAFVLTNPLFSNRKHHVDPFPATVKSRLQHCFFCTGSFELDSCGISQTTLCKVFSWIYWINLLRMLFETSKIGDCVYYLWFGLL